MSEDVTLETKGLDKLLKALKMTQPPVARVGILGGSKNVRAGNDGNSSNATIGAAHEFGAPAQGIPERSFLRVPIAEHLQKEMESSGALDKEVMADVIKDGTIVPWLKKVAVLAEGIVADAFATAGFGKWPAWKNTGYTNNAGQVLVDTGQLRNSITSEVKE
jgi:hypothetical protein